MKKNKIFIACDTTKIKKINDIINKTKTKKIQIGYKFGLEFINSKKGRKFISKLKRKIIFLDLKLNDIPNTCISTIKAVKDLKANYITIHISSGLESLKAVIMLLTKVGIIALRACGRTIKEILWNGFIPIAFAASYCPLGIDCRPPLMFSAKYAPLKNAVTISTLTIKLNSTPSGINTVSITLAKNNQVI